MTGVLAPEQMRCVAIVAHVDHGKTTLIDGLLKQSGIYRPGQEVAVCAMDSMDQERERGITILAKNASINYGDIKINLVDTPGHADFSGEVERIISMVDGCLLLVDASEGPLPQTRFVLEQALAANLRVVVVINKIDRPDRRITQVENEIFDLFVSLDASDEQMEYPTIYCAAREGIAVKEVEDYDEGRGSDLRPLFDALINDIPSPKVDKEAPFKMLVGNLGYSDYVGRLAIGRIYSGAISVNEPLACLKDGSRSNSRARSLYLFDGMQQVEVTMAGAGDIVVLAGVEDADIGDTIAAPEVEEALPRLQVEEPTLAMTLGVNNSPLVGKEGKFITSRQLLDRLEKELRSNVALRLEDSGQNDTWTLLGRGELHIGVLAEAMRREGYEFTLGRPHVITREIDGVVHEPIELLLCDLPDEYVGAVTEFFSTRGGRMTDMQVLSEGRQRITFNIPSRALIGVRSDFLTITRGEGMMHASFAEWRPQQANRARRKNGALVSDRSGQTVAYAMANLEERGKLFIGAGVDCYEGMIVGENSRAQDLNVNPCKTKQLTNIRSSATDEAIRLTPPVAFTMEKCMAWIDEDECIEVTPSHIRLRKVVLSAQTRPRKRVLEG